MTSAHRPNDAPVEAGPESILPLTDFRADPWGTGDAKAVAFRAGVLSSPVPAAFARRMREDGKAAARVTDLDGNPIERGADGTIPAGVPLDIGDEARARLPPLDPDAADDPSNYVTARAGKRKV